MLDKSLRFGAILLQPEFNRGGSLLEVGSGSKGIAAFVRDPVVGVDICFTEKPANGMIAIQASSAALPFADESFERVVSSDMLEHLDFEERALAIREMMRVTKRTLFITCPCGEGARLADRRLANLFSALRLPVQEWLKEHLDKRVPDPEEIEDTLHELNVEFKEIPLETIFLYSLVGLLSSNRGLNALWDSIFSGRPDRARSIAQWNLLPQLKSCRRLWVIDKSKSNGSSI